MKILLTIDEHILQLYNRIEPFVNMS